MFLWSEFLFQLLPENLPPYKKSNDESHFPHKMKYMPTESAILSPTYSF